MDVIIVGAGKVGYAVAQELSREGHNVTVVDKSPERINLVNGTLDVFAVCGESGIDSLQLAGAENAELLVAVTNSDEANILCCMVGRKLGVQHAIARVREAKHFRQVVLLQKELGLAMTVNPEHAAAREISRVLRFPSAAKVEPFAKSQAELVEFVLPQGSALEGVPLRDYHSRFGRGTLVCAVRRQDSVFIPKGADFVFRAGDSLSVVGAPKAIHALFKDLHIFRRPVRHVMIVGGGRISVFLAQQLLDMGIRVKIIEKDPERCEQVKDMLPKAELICGDGARPDLLAEEGLAEADGFVPLTGQDEINIILAAMAKKEGVEKVVTKVNEDHFVDLAHSFGLDAPVRPRLITAGRILQYVRGMDNSAGNSGVETLRRIVDGSLEALEFRADENCRCLGRTLMELPIRPGILVAAIIREGRCFIPGGSDRIEARDSVVAVAEVDSEHLIGCLDDILK